MGSDYKQRGHITQRDVSIHAPAWGATAAVVALKADSAFQSTLPHGERHRYGDYEGRSIPVSIHAPAWGATFQAAALGLSKPRERGLKLELTDPHNPHTYVAPHAGAWIETGFERPSAAA